MFKITALPASLICLSGIASGASSASYVIADKWPLAGDGGWDYPAVDAGAHLLYLSRATHVMVVDTTTGKALGEIGDTPGVHGIALAPDLGRGFISAGKADLVKVFDLRTREVLASIAVGSKPDAILYEPHTRRVVVLNGHSDNATVIDAASNKVLATIKLGGGPEFARTDGLGHVYVNIENKNELAALDIEALTVTAHWALPGCDGPSGLAFDAVHHRSFSVCANAAMTILDTQSGKSIATLPIGMGVDGAEFDPESQNAFSANGDGTLTVVHEIDPDHFAVSQTLSTPKGARTIALDAQTHRLYLPTAAFGPVKPGVLDAHPKPPILPGSFFVLVVAQQAVTK